MELKKEEMQEINGGGITSSMINAISKGINTLYELGKQTGAALRRIISGKRARTRKWARASRWARTRTRTRAIYERLRQKKKNKQIKNFIRYL